MVRKTKEESERTYHALLDAALDLFTERGSESTTLNDIAKEVNMTRGAVYWHFQNKGDIIMALWNRHALMMQEQFVKDINANPNADLNADPAENLTNALIGCVRSMTNTPHQQQVIRIVLSSLQVSNTDDPLQTYLRQIGAVFFDGIYSCCRKLESQNRLAAGLDARRAALGLWSYLNGIVQMSGSDSERGVNLEKDAEKLLNIYIDAVLIKQPVVQNSSI